MSYIKSRLQPGERVIFRIRRGRKWHHYLSMFILYFIALPLILWAMMIFVAPIIRALPQPAGMLLESGFLLLISIAVLLDFIHFFVDELALTNTRIIGRAMGATNWVFRKIDLPLSGIISAAVTGSTLKIRRKDGKNFNFNNLSESEQFATKVMQSTIQTNPSLV